jgi:hypothetical protein
MAFTIKQNDTRPAWSVPIKENYGESSEAALDLTEAASVKFLMRQKNDTGAPKVDAAATIEDAEAGVVSYTWEAGDTDTAGNFDAEVEITWDDGGVETVPNDSYWDITILDDLG